NTLPLGASPSGAPEKTPPGGAPPVPAPGGSFGAHCRLPHEHGNSSHDQHPCPRGGAPVHKQPETTKNAGKQTSCTTRSQNSYARPATHMSAFGPWREWDTRGEDCMAT